LFTGTISRQRLLEFIEWYAFAFGLRAGVHPQKLTAFAVIPAAITI
jgi:hypothetical protein